MNCKGCDKMATFTWQHFYKFLFCEYKYVILNKSTKVCSIPDGKFIHLRDGGMETKIFDILVIASVNAQNIRKQLHRSLIVHKNGLKCNTTSDLLQPMYLITCNFDKSDPPLYHALSNIQYGADKTVNKAFIPIIQNPPLKS